MEPSPDPESHVFYVMVGGVAIIVLTVSLLRAVHCWLSDCSTSYSKNLHDDRTPSPPTRPIAKEAKNLHEVALWTACETGDKELLSQLLNRPSHPFINRQRADGMTGLYLAVKNDYYSIVQMVVSKSEDLNVNIRADAGDTAFELACANGFRDMMGVIMTHKSFSWSAVNVRKVLATAIANERLRTASYILRQSGCQVDGFDIGFHVFWLAHIRKELKIACYSSKLKTAIGRPFDACKESVVAALQTRNVFVGDRGVTPDHMQSKTQEQQPVPSSPKSDSGDSMLQHQPLLSCPTCSL